MNKIVLLILCFSFKVGYSQYVVFEYKTHLFIRNDTVFSYHVYEKDGVTDSMICNDTLIRLNKKGWTSRKYSDGSYSISEFKKIKPSKWYKENKQKYFPADYECKLIRRRIYYSDGSIEKLWRFGSIQNVKIVKPRK